VGGGERGVAQLLGVERVGVRVAVFGGDEADGGLDELQEEVVLGPLLGAVEFAPRAVGAVDGEEDLDGDGDAAKRSS
jgi:hypothetical protein